MKVNYQERIDATVKELKIILSQQRTVINRQKIQALYCLKAGYSLSLTDVAERLGVHRVTVHRWLKKYSIGGLSGLLEIRQSTGRPRVIPSAVIAGLSKKLSDESCEFKSYKQIAKWVENNYKVSINYHTLYKQLHYRMKAKLKVPRRSSIKKDEQAAIDFKNTLDELLKMACWLESTTPNPAKKGVKYWCQDETRIGLKTIERKRITALGVKPKGKVQWNFKAFYLYGAVAPKTGESFWLEFSHLDGLCFQIFLDQLVEQYPDHLNIIQLDNGRFHHGSNLKIPDNVILIFQPPYSPELNPIERVWQHIKQELSWDIYDDLDGIKEKVCADLKEFSTETIASITGWNYILSALATVA